MDLSKSITRVQLTLTGILLTIVCSNLPAIGNTSKGIKLESFTYEARTQTTGKLRPNRDLTINSRLSETVENLPVDEGQSVETGVKLLQFDTTAHRIRVNRHYHRVQRAKHQLAISRKNYERKQSLRKKDLVSESEFDQAELEFKRAQENLAIARQDLRDARRNLSYTSVESPFRGILETHLVERGELVRRGQPLLQLIQLNPITIEFEVTPDERSEISDGDTIQVSLQGDTRPARITHLARSNSSGNGMYSGKARLPNPNRELIAGQTVNLTIPLKTIGNAVRIPLDYVDRQSDHPRVILRDPNTAAVHTRTLEIIDYQKESIITRRTWPANWRLVPGGTYTETGS
ncbi:MAG: efflux RND transporter periplasmic adaptor subunit [bacterium]